MARKTTNEKKYLRIDGADGDRRVLKTIIPLGNLSEKSIIRLLERLYCKRLDYEDIIAGSLPRNAKGYNDVFSYKIEAGGERWTATVGNGRHYTASVWRADELPSVWKRAVVEDD